jgi:hypothetical protein
MQALTPNLGLAFRRALGTGGGGEDAISTAELTKPGHFTQIPIPSGSVRTLPFG